MSSHERETQIFTHTLALLAWLFFSPLVDNKKGQKYLGNGLVGKTRLV